MVDARTCEAKAILAPLNLEPWYDSDYEAWLKYETCMNVIFFPPQNVQQQDDLDNIFFRR